MRRVWAVVAGASIVVGVLVGSAPTGGTSAPPAGTITVFAGNSTAGSSGNGGPAGQAELNNPSDEAVSLSGTVYIADFKNCQVRQVAPDGTISAFAGTGTCATSPLLNYGGQAAATQIGQPSGVAVDASGNVYIANCTTYISGCFQGNVAKVAPNGILTNFAGNGTVGSTGDGGPAASAEVATPWAVRTDRAGNVYFTDTTLSVVRKVNTAGIITTVAGTGTNGYGGDGGPATQAQLSNPTGLYVDASGNLFIADKDNFVIRKVAPNGVISTIAGNHIQGVSGDGGPATSAELNAPWGVVEDNVGAVSYTHLTLPTIYSV